MEKEFPEKVLEVLGYPREIAKPEKQYIFSIPKEGMVYDYRFIKEVIWSIIKEPYLYQHLEIFILQQRQFHNSG